MSVMNEAQPTKRQLYSVFCIYFYFSVLIPIPPDASAQSYLRVIKLHFVLQPGFSLSCRQAVSGVERYL